MIKFSFLIINQIEIYKRAKIASSNCFSQLLIKNKLRAVIFNQMREKNPIHAFRSVLTVDESTTLN